MTMIKFLKKYLIIGCILSIIPTQAWAECDSWFDINSYGLYCVEQSWAANLYYKNRHICSEDEFFIDETTAILGVGMLAVVGIVGVAATKTYLITNSPMVLNKIHYGICGTYLNKTDDEIINQLNGIVDSTVGRLTPYKEYIW